MSIFTPKKPDLTWVHSFLSESLVNAPGYKLDAPDIKIKLDQNESPDDWLDQVKDEILLRLKSRAWNRYPEPFPIQLQNLVAEHVGVEPQNILLSPGSNHLLTLVINAFCQNRKGKLVIARPSFPLYESHCQYMGIPYEPWLFNADYQYDLSLLPALDPGSIVLFASPNNPTGTSLGYEDFEKLLIENQDTLFIADEAYYEFSDKPYTPLLTKYSNLLLVRTFSKTLGTAGMRLGYLVGAETYVDVIRKLMVPYAINAFTETAVTYVLENKGVKQSLLGSIDQAKSERDFVFHELVESSQKIGIRVVPSEANFLLVKWNSQTECEDMYLRLIENGIIVRNVSKGPLLSGCLRITVGTRAQNQAVLKVLGC